MEKNRQIKETLIETRRRRKTQVLKVYELKVNVHHTSEEDFKKLSSMFVQTKWIQNDMIASNDLFHYNYKNHRTIKNYDKDGNLVERKLDLNTGIHQVIIGKVKQDILNLHKAKEKGIKVGALKFRKTCNCIPLRTGQLHVVNSKTVSIPGFRNLKVYGLNQFMSFPDYEIADARIVRKASGIYLKVSVCIPKSNVERIKTNKEVGLDFGIKDNIVTSDGEKFNCSVQESEHLKFLQKKLTKKQKGSKRYYKCLNQLQKEYEHLTNKKNDDSNKLIAYLLKNYDVIYFQDENLAQWKKKKCSKKTGKKINAYSFGKEIQHSYLGRVKVKLVEIQKSGRSLKVSKWLPTTQFCPQCGALNKMTLDKRVYRCECGYSYDRDIHAAKNVKLFGSTKRAEWLEQPSVESLASIALKESFDAASQDVETKKEDSSLKARISSLGKLQFQNLPKI